jgi:hypothetical protein
MIRLPVTIALISAIALFAYWSNASAEVVAGMHEGSAISAVGTSDSNVYIINDAGYKRWVVNPVAIFSLYGHLNNAAVLNVSSSVRDQFQTSGLFRNCETNAQAVYALEVNGSTNMLHWINMTASDVMAADPAFFSKVFCINSREQAYYTMGVNYVSMIQVPSYSAGTSPAPISSPLPSQSPSPSPTVSPSPSPTISPTASPSPSPTP